MNITKTEFENHISIMANGFGLQENYQKMMDPFLGIGPGLPKIVEMIVYEMCINEFDKNNCSTDELLAYEQILIYAQELRLKGWVDFK